MAVGGSVTSLKRGAPRRLGYGGGSFHRGAVNRFRIPRLALGAGSDLAAMLSAAVAS